MLFASPVVPNFVIRRTRFWIEEVKMSFLTEDSAKDGVHLLHFWPYTMMECSDSILMEHHTINMLRPRIYQIWTFRNFWWLFPAATPSCRFEIFHCCNKPSFNRLICWTWWHAAEVIRLFEFIELEERTILNMQMCGLKGSGLRKTVSYFKHREGKSLKRMALKASMTWAVNHRLFFSDRMVQRLVNVFFSPLI